MGVLVAPTRFLTCAHVVNRALGRDLYESSTPDPDALIKISFPILQDTQTMQAKVLDWSPPGTAGLDCAVMELTTASPKEVGISILSVIAAEDLMDETMSLYGSLDLGHPGAHVNAQVEGAVGAGWSQLTVNGSRGIRPGFSGAGIWARHQRATVGLAIALQEGSGGIVGYFLSAARIAERFSALIPVETRRVSLQRQRSFTLASVLLFVLLLIHFLASTGSGARNIVPWAEGTKLLAAYFGVHCFAIILGPYVMWHALQHARSFARRRWWMRVPAFTLGTRAEMLDNTRGGAGAVVLFLLLLPAIAQFSMMRATFFEKHEIYVNVERLRVKGAPEVKECNPRELKWCTHDDVGTWAFLFRTPYFDHAYQYGEPCVGHADCEMVTFYPTLQPFILLFGTGLAFLWFLMFLYALIRPFPYASYADA